MAKQRFQQSKYSELEKIDPKFLKISDPVLKGFKRRKKFIPL